MSAKDLCRAQTNPRIGWREMMLYPRRQLNMMIESSTDKPAKMRPWSAASGSPGNDHPQLHTYSGRTLLSLRPVSFNWRFGAAGRSHPKASMWTFRLPSFGMVAEREASCKDEGSARRRSNHKHNQVRPFLGIHENVLTEFFDQFLLVPHQPPFFPEPDRYGCRIHSWAARHVTWPPYDPSTCDSLHTFN